MSEESKSISIVVPVFNAQATLRPLCEQIKAALDAEKRPYEVILVNDGSSDTSWNRIQEISAENELVTGINLMRNYGQHNALLCGIREAQYETIVTMDDDLQHPPETIHILLEKLDEGFDVVYGAPNIETHGIFRDASSIITKIVLQKVMKVKTARYVSSYRAFRTNLRNAFTDFQGASMSIDVLLSWGTTRFAYVKVDHREREAGSSHYTFAKLLVHTMNMLTGYSTLPLRISSGIGFLFTLFGIVVLLYALIHYMIQGGVVPGFTFTASLIAIFSGAQLFTLGIMGEYLARMHFKLMDKPTYVVKDKLSHKTNS